MRRQRYNKNCIYANFLFKIPIKKKKFKKNVPFSCAYQKKVLPLRVVWILQGFGFSKKPQKWLKIKVRLNRAPIINTYFINPNL